MWHEGRSLRMFPQRRCLCGFYMEKGFVFLKCWRQVRIITMHVPITASIVWRAPWTRRRAQIYSANASTSQRWPQHLTQFIYHIDSISGHALYEYAIHTITEAIETLWLTSLLRLQPILEGSVSGRDIPGWLGFITIHNPSSLYVLQ